MPNESAHRVRLTRMWNVFDPAQKSLTIKLVIAVSGLILFCGFLLWLLDIHRETKNSMQDALSFIASLSEITKQSISYDMLTVKRDDIQLTLENIVRSGSIEQLRIINNDGLVSFSTNTIEIGKRVGDEKILQLLPDVSSGAATGLEGTQWYVDDAPGDYRVLTFIEPILNEPDCYTATCHFHENGNRVLGFLASDYSLRAIDERLKENMTIASIYLIFFVAVVALALSYILWNIVIRPVTELATGMKHVSAGDLSHKVLCPSQDEIGRLATTFNEMTEELHATRKKLQKWNQRLAEEVTIQTQQIQQAQDKLIQAEKLAALGRLSADIAHEIRNPLTALGGFGRRLLKSAITEKQKEYAQIVVSEVDRLEKILRDVLTFSHETRLEVTKTPLDKVIREAIAFFSAMLQEHAISYEIINETTLPVLIDTSHTRQAINNLILNAIDAISNDGKLTMITRAERKNDIDYVVLHITDTGPGIPDETLATIFEPFRSGKMGHGTGLGLAISRRIIEEHGGFIKAVNNVGMGCTVSLYFPYQSDDEKDETPCWEYMQCGRDTNHETRCPAHPHFGRVCWAIAGTFCAGKVKGSLAQKIPTCTKCKFYLKVRGKAS